MWLFYEGMRQTNTSNCSQPHLNKTKIKEVLIVIKIDFIFRLCDLHKILYFNHDDRAFAFDQFHLVMTIDVYGEGTIINQQSKFT